MRSHLEDGKRKYHHETSVHYWLVFNCSQKEKLEHRLKLTFKKTVPSVDGNVCPHQSLSHILSVGKTKYLYIKKTNFYEGQSDPCGCQTADEGDTAEAHPPKEDRAGRLHDEVLQKNPQLCEQGAGVETGLINTRLWQLRKVI